MTYTGIRLEDTISIDELFSVHYFEYMSDFSFAGEKHDFWEFICVDKGTVNVTANTRHYVLKKDDILFHQPNEFHNVTANGSSAPNLVIASFSCHNPTMEYFRGKLLKIDATERNLLANIVMEARNCIDWRLDDPYLQHVPLKSDASLASQQMIRLYLEHFLIHMLRRGTNYKPSPSAILLESMRTSKSQNSLAIFQRVVDYMVLNVCEHLTIEQICRDNLVGRSQLQKIFQHHCQMGIIEYFSILKIRYAKELIRTGHRNFTQISDALGYSSVHYFSRKFKKLTGMTPSEYTQSIKAISEQPIES